MKTNNYLKILILLACLLRIILNRDKLVSNTSGKIYMQLTSPLKKEISRKCNNWPPFLLMRHSLFQNLEGACYIIYACVEAKIYNNYIFIAQMSSNACSSSSVGGLSDLLSLSLLRAFLMS